MSPSFCHLVGEEIRNGLASIPKNLMQLALVGLVIFVLGKFGIGNWLRCVSLDSQGCLARFTISVNASQISADDKFETEQRYQRIKDKPQSGHVFVRYDVTLRNIGYANIDKADLRVVPMLPGSSPGILVGYRAGSGPLHMSPEYKDNILSLLSVYFDPVSSFMVTEQAQVSLFIAYLQSTYESQQGPRVSFEVRCDTCQVPFRKMLSP